MNVIGKKISVFQSVREGKKYIKKLDYQGIILGIGSEYEELQNGVGQFPVFIVMKEDGEIDNCYTSYCKIILK